MSPPESKTAQERFIIGIDPGTQVTGYGIIKLTPRALCAVDFGCIRPPSGAKLSDRYYAIFQAVQSLLGKYNPEMMAIESQFFSLNAQSALKLGIAQGSAIIAAKEHKLPVFGYSPREVKCSVVGTGKATKQQLQGAVQRLLGLKTAPKPYDAADALAIAICHCYALQRAFQHKNKEI